jgi:hypothetical protein
MNDPATSNVEAGGEVTRRRRWPWVLLTLLVLTVVGLRAALPFAVERGAAYGSRYWLGLPARIDNADFDLANGIVVLEGVSVGAEPDGVDPTGAAMEPPLLDAAKSLLHLDRIALQLSWQDLREGKIRLVELELQAPSVRVIRESDGAIDPLRHAKPLAPASVEEPAEEAGEPWPIAVDRFSLSAPNVVIVDPPSGQNLLEFSLEKFDLASVSVNGSQFALGGVGLDRPLLRVRRDLVLAAPAAPAKEAPPPKEVPPPKDATPAKEAAAAKEAAPAEPAPGSEVKIPAEPAPAEAPSASPPEATPGPAPAVQVAAPLPATQPAGYRIEKIEIARANFTWVTDKGPLDVALALKATDITADEGKRFPIDLDLEIEKGRIGLEGEVGLLPPAYKGKVQWSGLPFPPLLLASLPELAAWLKSADSTGDLVVDADIAGANGPPTIRMSGRSTVDALGLADPGNKELSLGWKQLEVVMKELVVPLTEAGKPARTTVASFDLVKLTEPRIRYTHPSPAVYALLGIPVPVPAPAEPVAATPKGHAGKSAKEAAPGAKPAVATAKVAAAEKPKAAAPEPSPQPSDAPPPVDVSIAALVLEAGDLELKDTTVAPPVTSYLQQLFVSARNVHFPDPEAKAINVKAVLPKTSVLTIDGDLRRGNNGDFTISLQKLDLPVFSPYAAIAGASLDAGQASIKTKLKMRGTKLQVDNELVLAKLGVSLRDPSSFDRTFGMPIDLALALLRDPKGDIHLTIPVLVDEKGAQVSTGAIIASALKAALIGAVTSPLKLLGGVFGGGGEGEGGAPGLAISPIGSTPGLADLGAEAPARSDGLARLLSDRPTMVLVLKGRTGPEDRPVVAEQILVERLKAGDGLPDMEGAGFLAKRRIGQALLARDPSAAKKKEPEPLSKDDQALCDRYIAGVEIPAARLDELARRRAENFRGLLVARKVPDSRVQLAAREPDGSPGVVLGLSPK